MLFSFTILLGGAYALPLSTKFGINGGYKIVVFDELGESYKAKIQNSYGFNIDLDIIYRDLYLGLWISLPGLWYIDESDALGGYYYPGKIEMPFTIGIEGYTKVMFGNSYMGDITGGIGFNYATVVTFSYYTPVDYIPGISLKFDYSFFLHKARLLNIPGIGFNVGFRWAKFFGEYDNFSYLSVVFGILLEVDYSKDFGLEKNNEAQIKEILRM